MLSRRFLNTRRLDKALEHMCDKPIGYYVFMRPDNAEGVRFTVLLRYQANTVRYNIRPNEDYRKYIMSTLEGWEICYESIAEFIEQWDESRVEYEMIRKVEMDEMSAGAQPDLAASKGARGTQIRSSLDDVSTLLGVSKLSEHPCTPESTEAARCVITSTPLTGPMRKSAPRWTRPRASDQEHRVRTGSVAHRADRETENMNKLIQDFLDKYEHNNVGFTFLGMNFLVFQGLPVNALRAMGVTDKFISDHRQMIETASLLSVPSVEMPQQQEYLSRQQRVKSLERRLQQHCGLTERSKSPDFAYRTPAVPVDTAHATDQPTLCNNCSRL